MRRSDQCRSEYGVQAMITSRKTIAFVRSFRVLHRVERVLAPDQLLVPIAIGSRSRVVCQRIVNVAWVAKRKKRCYWRSWRIALLERFWQAANPPDMAPIPLRHRPYCRMAPIRLRNIGLSVWPQRCARRGLPIAFGPRPSGSSPFRRLRSEQGGRLCAYLKPKTTGVTPDNRPGRWRLRGSRRKPSSLRSSVEPYHPTV